MTRGSFGEGKKEAERGREEQDRRAFSVLRELFILMRGSNDPLCRPPRLRDR